MPRSTEILNRKIAAKLNQSGENQGNEHIPIQDGGGLVEGGNNGGQVCLLGVVGAAGRQPLDLLARLRLRAALRREEGAGVGAGELGPHDSVGRLRLRHPRLLRAGLDGLQASTQLHYISLLPEC